jgi:selenocysteine-specific elongation factor
MEICTLLGIKHGLVALTKVDLVDEEWLELAMEDVSEFTQGSFLEDAPILPVSSTSGEGLKALIEALDTLSAVVPERAASTLFRLPVDRVFTMKGFGTVITGTLASGSVQVGDTIMLYPSGITSKVRGIQVHNQSVQTAQAGMRTAINFQGLEKSAVQRGDVLASADSLKPSYMVDVELLFLNSNKKPLKSRTRVRFHTGTNEILGNLILLDREELNPGEAVVAQLRLDAPVVLVKDDRYVIRSYSPIRTIGGGQILNPIPQKHKRFRDDIVSGLEALTQQEPSSVIDFHLMQAGFKGLAFGDLKIMANLAEKALDRALAELLSKRTVIIVDRDARLFVHGEHFSSLMQQMQSLLAAYHEKNPLRPGMPKEELKSKFPALLSGKLINLVMNQLIKEKKIVQEEKTVKLAGHKIALQVDLADVRKKIIATYASSGLTPPYFRELAATLKIEDAQAKEVLMLLIQEGMLIKVKEDLYFDPQAIDQLQKALIDYLQNHGEMSTPQFKDIAKVSRKYLIPLIEYFDAQNVTIRIGDIRKLRKSS